MRRPVPAVLGLVALCGLMATGCGNDSEDGSATPSTTTGAVTGESTHTTYPVTVEDCNGRATTYDEAPSRVVTLDPSVTEMLLVLGLKDRIVGYTEFYTEDQKWSVTSADMATLEQINDGANYPSQEVVVAAQPDLVMSVYPYAYADPLPTQDGWTDLGVRSYLTLGGCDTDQHDFSTLYRDLRNLGEIFDVQAQAEAEIADLEARVTAAQARARDAGVGGELIAPYDGFYETPTSYGGNVPIIEMAGAKYIWSDLGATDTPSWEQFVDRNPTVIWILPDAGKAVSDVESELEGDQRLSSVAGVKERAWVIVPRIDATLESPRLVDGLDTLVDGLIELQTG